MTQSISQYVRANLESLMKQPLKFIKLNQNQIKLINCTIQNFIEIDDVVWTCVLFEFIFETRSISLLFCTCEKVVSYTNILNYSLSVFELTEMDMDLFSSNVSKVILLCSNSITLECCVAYGNCQNQANHIAMTYMILRVHKWKTRVMPQRVRYR